MATKDGLFRICKFLMLIGGLWRNELENVSKFKNYLYEIYSVGIQVYFSSNFALFLMQFFKLIEANNTPALLDNISKMIFFTIIVAKITLCRSKKITYLLNSVIKEESNIDVETDQEVGIIYQKYVKYFKTVIFANLATMYFTGIVGIGDGLFESYRFSQTHKNLNETMDKFLFLPLWYPFDINKHYLWATAHQTVLGFSGFIFYSGTQALVYSLMIFIIAHIKILQHRVTNIEIYQMTNKNLKLKDVVQRSTKMCAIQHQKLISWVEDFDASLKYFLLVEYAFTSLQLAATLIQVIKRTKIPFSSCFFLLCSFQLFILAWNANEILFESSTGLQNALYNSKWYNQSKETKVMLQIMMMRCRRPLTLSIGPFGQMNVDAAVSRMKLAYSYLSVMSA